MTPEERKQMIKELIDRIPTAKDDLFAFPIDWKYVDSALVEQRVSEIFTVCVYFVGSGFLKFTGARALLVV